MTANIGQRIRWSEFGHQLSKIGALQDALQCPVRPKIAVGVSGGADSMALAYLLHHFVYDKDHERKAFDVYSFIVDHGARVESRDEALVVKQNLDNLGIRSEILSIRWPKSFDPKTDSAFEENARVARYDLIMRSAMHYGCKALFTGHHLDDNIETLLFRLARNKQHPLHSLCGIQDKSLVPCEHTFGVHGYSEIREARYSKSQKRQSSNSDISIRERPHRGSNLYRPLLGFPKSRILATCTSYTIPYVDDKTNHDPMFATRNAIRYMRQFDLPKALQAPRLLGLQKRARSFLSDIENSAKNLCRTMSRLRIYTNTGTMEVKAEVPLAAVDDQSWQYLMARILEVVAPQTGTDFPALMPALKMRAILNLDKNDKLEPVMLRKTLIYVKSAFNSDTVSLHLVLHRQPLSKGDLKKARLPFVLDTSSDIELSAQIFSSKYILWDDRFWIRVSCPSEDAISKISIRAYETEDISEVKSALKAQSRDREFDCEMRRIFPSRFSDFRPSNRAPISAFVRHTLPVLVYNDHIVAFPTLNFSVQPELVPQLSWQVKYRRADRVLDFFTAHFSQTDPGISPVLGEDVKKGHIKKLPKNPTSKLVKVWSGSLLFASEAMYPGAPTMLRAAICHVSPVFLSAEQTTQKAIKLIRQASKQSANLVVFPETYIPAFPIWSALQAPHQNHDFFFRMVQESVYADGEEINAVRNAAREAGVLVNLGFSEKSHHSNATLYNSNILISEEGKVLVHHRKLMPTFFEKLTWSPGDGAGLRVGDTKFGRIGTLICGENTNPLARFSLMAQAEQVHISTWPGIWPTRIQEQTEKPTDNISPSPNYDNLAANRIRAAAHCFEAKCFGILSAGLVDAACKEAIASNTSQAQLLQAQMDAAPQAASMFLDPTGALLPGFVINEETGAKQVKEFLQKEPGILYADLDLDKCIEGKQYHDVTGGYQRLDVFDLKVDRSRRDPVVFTDSSSQI